MSARHSPNLLARFIPYQVSQGTSCVHCVDGEVFVLASFISISAYFSILSAKIIILNLIQVKHYITRSFKNL
jgi:hypothetical protein